MDSSSVQCIHTAASSMSHQTKRTVELRLEQQDRTTFHHSANKLETKGPNLWNFAHKFFFRFHSFTNHKYTKVVECLRLSGALNRGIDDVGAMNVSEVKRAMKKICDGGYKLWFSCSEKDNRRLRTRRRVIAR